MPCSDSAVVWDGSIDLAGLLNELLNHLINILLIKVGHIDAPLHAEIVACHHGGLSIQALTDNEREVWVLRLNVHIVVVDVLSTQDQLVSPASSCYLPDALRVRGGLTKDEAQLSDAL